MALLGDAGFAPACALMPGMYVIHHAHLMDLACSAAQGVNPVVHLLVVSVFTAEPGGC